MLVKFTAVSTGLPIYIDARSVVDVKAQADGSSEICYRLGGEQCVTLLVKEPGSEVSVKINAHRNR